MGLLKFTKQYSATNDGEKYAGTDIGTMQADIASILNGGISNVNIASDAAIVESKISFNTTSGHTHNGTDSKSISSSGVVAVGTIWGAELVYSAADKVYAKPGSIEINGTLYSRTAVSTSIDTDTNTHFISGSSEKGASKWLYVYAYNDSGSSWDLKYSATAPAYSNCGTSTDGNKMFLSASSVWYRCIGAVRLDGSSNILAFFQDTNKITYDIPIAVTSTLSEGSWSAATSCATSIPAVSQCGIFGMSTTRNSTNASNCWIRRNGSTFAINRRNGVCTEYGGTASGQRICMTDSSQQIQYYTVSTDSWALDTEGYFLNIR